MIKRSREIPGLQARVHALIGELFLEAQREPGVPQSIVDADFMPAATLNVDLFFDCLRRDAEPTEQQIAPMVARARALRRDGMSMAQILQNYQFGVTFVWSRLLQSAAEGEHDALLDLLAPLTRYMSIVTEHLVLDAAEPASQQDRERLDQRRAVTGALLDGREPVRWLPDSAPPIAAAFLVAVLRVGRPQPGVMTSLRDRINDVPGAFVRLDSGGWTALIPLDSTTSDQTAIEQLESWLVATVPNAGNESFRIGVSPARSRDRIPAAAAEAKALAALGRCLARPGLVIRREALQFEYTIAVSGVARSQLAATLAPLDRQPKLTETLEAFIDSGFNQLATGRILNIHRKTVTYRLARVHELTGHDPQHPADAITLSAARIARQLEAAAFTVD